VTGVKGHRALQFGIISSRGTLKRIRQPSVEDIFALAVRFDIAGHRAEQSALRGSSLR